MILTSSNNATQCGGHMHKSHHTCDAGRYCSFSVGVHASVRPTNEELLHPSYDSPPDRGEGDEISTMDDGILRRQNSVWGMPQLIAGKEERVREKNSERREW